jgi:hypothetical protein
MQLDRRSWRRFGSLITEVPQDPPVESVCARRPLEGDPGGAWWREFRQPALLAGQQRLRQTQPATATSIVMLPLSYVVAFSSPTPAHQPTAVPG